MGKLVCVADVGCHCCCQRDVVSDCFSDGTQERIMPHVVPPRVPSHTAVVKNMQ